MTEVKEAPKPKSQDSPGATELAPRHSAAPAARHVNPVAYLGRLAREMDRMVDEFGLGLGLHVPRFLSRGHELLRREAGLISAEWSPRIDVANATGSSSSASTCRG